MDEETAARYRIQSNFLRCSKAEIVEPLREAKADTEFQLQPRQKSSNKTESIITQNWYIFALIVNFKMSQAALPKIQIL